MNGTRFKQRPLSQPKKEANLSEMGILAGQPVCQGECSRMCAIGATGSPSWPRNWAIMLFVIPAHVWPMYLTRECTGTIPS
jgi:hypothetical protein